MITTTLLQLHHCQHLVNVVVFRETNTVVDTSDHGAATVDNEVGAVHEASGARAEEEDGANNLVGETGAADDRTLAGAGGDVSEIVLETLTGLGGGTGHLRGEDTGANGVDADLGAGRRISRERYGDL